MTNEKPRLFGLDLMRAFAVSLVVVGHLLQHGMVPKWIHNLQRLGIFGVEIFFVLSGFLIGGILIRLVESRKFNTKADLFDFLKRRWLRTLPLYYLFFFIYLRFDWTGPATLGEHSNFLIFAQGLAWAPPDFFLLSWSLAIEEYFYLLFPLFLFGLLKIGKNPKAAFITAIATFLVLPILLRAAQTPFVDWDAFNYGIRMVTIDRLDALMYGVAAAYLYRFHQSVWNAVADATKFSGMLFFGVMVFIYADNPGLWGRPLSGALQIFYFPLLSFSVALLLPALVGLQVSRRTLTVLGIERLSLISYSVYLGHIAMITIVDMSPWPPGIRLWLASPLHLYAIEILMITAFAEVTYRFCERPFMRLRDGHFKSLSRVLRLART